MWDKADIYKLNLFAERFQRLEDHQKAGFKSVLMRNPDSSIDDMIQIPEEKLAAIEMYLEQKNTTLVAELDKQVEQIYTKVVPQNVREYIELTAKQQIRRTRRSVESSPKPEQ